MQAEIKTGWFTKLYNYEGDEIWLGVFDTEEEANNKSSLRNLMKVVGRG